MNTSDTTDNGKQVFLNVRLNFNLRQVKTDVPTPIYAVYVFDGKQYKVPTGVKVLPSQWCKDSQQAVESNVLNKYDNRNNAIANKCINDFRERFSKTINEVYKGNNNEDFPLLFQQRNRINMSKEPKKQPLVYTFSVLADKYKQLTGKDISNYNNTISNFRKFIKEKGIEDDVRVLNLQTLNQYRDWLLGSGKAIKTIRDLLSAFRTLVEMLNKMEQRTGDNYIDIRAFEMPKDNRNKEEKQSKVEPLTEEELTSLWKYDDLTEKETEARDIFVAQCLCGQRISDLPKVLSPNFPIIRDGDIECMSFHTIKTNETAVIPLFPQLKEIRERYTDGFKHWKLEYIEDEEEQKTRVNSQNYKLNNIIKRVAKKAGINRVVSYTEQIGCKKETKTAPLYELIHTHIARHTFVSIMARMGVPKDTIKIVTAHTNDAIIDQVYLHVTAEDKGRTLLNSLRSNTQLQDSRLFGGLNNTTEQPYTPNATLTPTTTPTESVLIERLEQKAVEAHIKEQQYIQQMEEKERQTATREVFILHTGMTPEKYKQKLRETNQEPTTIAEELLQKLR